MFGIGVFAIVFDEHGRVLLCHRRDVDLWNLPGGGLEPGETPWDGVVREVREETGLEVAVQRLAGVYSKPEVNEVVFSFVCDVVGGALALRACYELRDRFCPVDADPSKVMAPDLRSFSVGAKGSPRRPIARACQRGSRSAGSLAKLKPGPQSP